MGASPIHAITLGLVRNVHTDNITPKFHLVFDKYFETIYIGEDKESPVWSELITFKSFKSSYDDEEYVPSIEDECFES